VVRTLGEMGYGGFVSAEILPQPGVLDAAWQTIAVLRPLVPRPARRTPDSPLGTSGNGQTRGSR
jgi:hypothetical protein